MSQPKAVTKMEALANKRGSRADKAKSLDELVPSPGGTVTTPESAAGRPRAQGAAGPSVPCATLGGPGDRLPGPLLDPHPGPSGNRLAPMLATVVPLLHRDGDIVPRDDEAALLVAMSAATIDRRLAPGLAVLANQKLVFKQRDGAKAIKCYDRAATPYARALGTMG